MADWFRWQSEQREEVSREKTGVVHHIPAAAGGSPNLTNNNKFYANQNRIRLVKIELNEIGYESSRLCFQKNFFFQTM